MIWSAKFYKFIFALALFLTGLVLFLWVDETPIIFESLESKTTLNGAVFNKIQYQSNSESEVWLMEQSHTGAGAPQHEWDKIAIVVKNDKSDRTAQFYQLQPGSEPISMSLKPIGLKASCFLCHSNGPRAIRPNLDSKEIKISYWDQARIQLWNLKIKSYGPMESISSVPSKKKFRFEHPMANRKLEVESCTKCHNSEVYFGRGALTKQNFMTIKFMVENKFMPPPGFELSESDKAALNEFIDL
jgi:hypothetical protein